jgi:hypothetical protein
MGLKMNRPPTAKQNGNGSDLRGMPADLSKFYPPTPTYEQLMGSNKK